MLLVNGLGRHGAGFRYFIPVFERAHRLLGGGGAGRRAHGDFRPVMRDLDMTINMFAAFRADYDHWHYCR